ncbi:hypothetical protein BN2475_1040010 [Paraburkholderia ribeironis]|uniref:Uncharacterized protein n=1 Tax=Paraburkholderia ribeironis TaxID=1247936 RepID=A0A1N7SM33_9BURK|nr:hypothetical protein BN2475_1040010 [Paraburkholderia ribeironis]
MPNRRILARPPNSYRNRAQSRIPMFTHNKLHRFKHLQQLGTASTSKIRRSRRTDFHVSNVDVTQNTSPYTPESRAHWQFVLPVHNSPHLSVRP